VLEFRPERFLSDADENGVRTIVQPSPYAFPAFNAGFRMCLGRSMALMNAKILSSAVLRRFRLRTKPGHDPMYKISIVLVQRDGLPMTVEARE
jgi:cytochrome P450